MRGEARIDIAIDISGGSRGVERSVGGDALGS
jgi:hypothetical protein